LSPGFNTTSAEAGVTLPHSTMSAPGFHTAGQVHCYEDGLSKLCLKCVLNAWKRLDITGHILFLLL